MPLILPVTHGLPISKASSEQVARATCCCRRAVPLRKTDLGLSLLGVVGWFALPKCPLCLAAWVAMLSGLSLSVGVSNVVLTLLTIAAAGCFLVGMFRLGNVAWKNFSRSDT